MKKVLTIIFICFSFCALAQPGKINFSVDPFTFKINRDTTKSINFVSPLYFLNDSTVVLARTFLDSLRGHYFDTGAAIRNNYVIAYDSTNKKWVMVAQSGGAGGTPGGSDTYVQFNDAGSFNGTSGLRFNKTLQALQIAGYTETDSIQGSTISGGNLTLFSTNNATKGKIIFGTSAYDEVNNRMGFGTITPAYLVEANKSTNGAERIAITNPNSGTSAQALLQSSNGTASFQAGVAGTGYTTAGLITAGTVYFQSNSATKLLFRASSNSLAPPIIFATSDGSTDTERWRIDWTTGNFSNTGAAGTEKIHISGNLLLGTAGNKIKITTGTNASVGTATLVAGTVTVSTTAALTASLIYVTVKTPGGTQGFLSVPTITNATSFVINSTSATETSTVNWWIIN